MSEETKPANEAPTASASAPAAATSKPSAPAAATSKPSAPAAATERKKHTLYMIQPVTYAGKVIARGEVLAEVTVHADSALHHALGVIRNGLFSTVKPVDEPKAGK